MPTRKSGSVHIVLIVGVIVLAVLAALFLLPKDISAPISPTVSPIATNGQTPMTPVNNGACTMDAKQCPDGSYVGRNGPKCEFAACPSVDSLNWTTYTGTDFSFRYPNTILIYPKDLSSSESVYITNRENVTGPREMTIDGIWVEATVYPSTAKTSLIKDTEAIMNAKVGTLFTHPITPYSEKFMKVKELTNNGVLIRSTEMKDIQDSREIESALWLKNNRVYQLRVVVVTQSSFNNFESVFNGMIESFKITN